MVSAVPVACSAAVLVGSGWPQPARANRARNKMGIRFTLALRVV